MFYLSRASIENTTSLTSQGRKKVAYTPPSLDSTYEITPSMVLLLKLYASTRIHTQIHSLNPKIYVIMNHESNLWICTCIRYPHSSRAT
uniref:Putative ovule protein n=1 Tax=Solanum chacoense TaxID=4108 RepID=A0A0V0IL45_SOLCH